MQINDEKIEQIITKLESAIENIGSINKWLPLAINDALDGTLYGHRGTLDRVDLDRMKREREEDEQRKLEIDNLRSQLREVQKQTSEIKKQTKYLFYAFIITLVGFLFNIALQINPNLFGLI